MPISPAEAVGTAFSRMARLCFQPFDFKKWLIFAFCSFLATCGESGASIRVPDSGSSSPGSSSPFPALGKFVADHLVMVIVITALILILALAIHLALLYLRCRGRLLFLDNIVMNRPAVTEPWKRLAPQANSYFKFNLLLMAYTALVILGSSLAGLLVASSDIINGTFTGLSIGGIVLTACLMLPLLIWLVLVSLFARDFVLPIMLIRNTTFRAAWEEARAVVVRGHLGSLILFYLLALLFAIASFVIAYVVGCVTFCIGFLPYISAVLTLPLLVFQRVYPLAYLEQFGPDYRLMKLWPPSTHGFPIEPDPPPPPPPYPMV